MSTYGSRGKGFFNKIYCHLGDEEEGESANIHKRDSMIEKWLASRLTGVA